MGFRGESYLFHDECFAPVQVNLYGMPCETVRPAAHLALSYSRGKYRIGHEILKRNIPADELDFLESGAYGPLWTPQRQ